MDYVTEHLKMHREMAVDLTALSRDDLQRLIDRQLAVHAQFSPRQRPSPWERLKRWWYSL